LTFTILADNKKIMFDKPALCYLLLAIFNISSIAFSSTASGAIPAEEREILIEIYNSNNGDEWRSSYYWKRGTLAEDGFSMPGTEGKWNGVTINDDRVVGLDFSMRRLSGGIPPAICRLSELRKLNLSYCGLNGSILPAIGDLSRLELLDLSNNQLSGSIPREIRKLTRLKNWGLDICGNRLTTDDESLRKLLNSMQYEGRWEECQLSDGSSENSGNGTNN